MKNVRKNTNTKRKWLVIILILAVAVLLFAGGMRLLDVRNQAATMQTQTTNQNNDDPKQQVTPNPNVPGGSTDTDNDNVKLVAPTGTFVSHHRPSVSGSGGPVDMFSSCTVETPGASCSIRFTQGSIVKELEKKKVGGDDNTATWEWNIKTVGLTPGEWTVEAVATYGNQELTSKDVTPLQVKP